MSIVPYPLILLDQGAIWLDGYGFHLHEREGEAGGDTVKALVNRGRSMGLSKSDYHCRVSKRWRHKTPLAAVVFTFLIMV